MRRDRQLSPFAIGQLTLFVVGYVIFAGLATLIGGWSYYPMLIVTAIGGIVFQETRKRRRRRPQAPVPVPPGALVIGTTQEGAPVALTDRQLAAHGLILGAAGSGKTTTLLRILCDQIVAGRPVVAVDLKGSNSFANTMRSACAGAGRSLHVWSPGGPGHYNPLAYGDASELKDKLISFERFSEPHYQRAAERYLQTAIQVLQQARPDRPVTLAAIANLLEPTNLVRLLPHVPKELMARVGPYVSNLTRDQQSAVMGLQSRLVLLTESTPGAYLQPGDAQVDPWHALCEGNEVLLFSLNASRYGKLSAQIAALLIQDLIAVSGYRLGLEHRPLAMIAIDEFSSLDTDNLLALFNKAREAGVSVILSTQEMADLERLARGFRDQVLGNTAFAAIHRQNVPDSAELIARMIGTRTVWKHTYQTEKVHGFFGGYSDRQTGRGSARQVEEFRIHPNVIKELPTGVAVIMTKIPTSTAQIVRITPWTPPAGGPHAS